MNKNACSNIDLSERRSAQMGIRMRILLSEWLKTKHTILRWLILFMPVCAAACLLAYMAYRTELTTVFLYEAFYMVWGAVVIPVITGLVAGLLAHEEELAGNYTGYLNTSIPRAKLYVGKFIFAALCLLACTLITTLILCAGMELMQPAKAQNSLFLAASLLTVAGALPILAIHMWLGFLWGMGASIGVGICGILMAVIIGTTGLGDKIWMLVPWSYPVKMSMIPLFGTLASGSMAGTAEHFIILCALSIILSIVFLTGGSIWFHRFFVPRLES